MDIGALGVDRLQLVILDMHCDAKGLTLLSIPQVKYVFMLLISAIFWAFEMARNLTSLCRWIRNI